MSDGDNQKNRKTRPYLSIDVIDSSPSLASKLPSHLAHQYHAIPIASDQNRVTVAMANPEDSVARQAIRSAVMYPATLVKADSRIIDSLIAKCYSETSTTPLKFLAWTPDEQVNPVNQAYIHSLSKLLNADLTWFEPSEKKGETYSSLVEKIDTLDTDLLISSYPTDSLQQRLALVPSEKKLLHHCSTSLLSLKTPRWPIRQILLVLQEHNIDGCAVEWAIRLARASKASLTILPVIPAVPAVFADMQHDLSKLLSSDCQLGRHLHQVARRLVDWEINGTIKLRDEFPEWQIRWEVDEGDNDLIIIAADLQNQFRNLVVRDLVLPLLNWVHIPVLISQAYPKGG
ncbi:MAG: universal stress protein [Anaerolineales bacterium]|nr:universal stress protein [Anaerolineales bacterium]